MFNNQRHLDLQRVLGRISYSDDPIANWRTQSARYLYMIVSFIAMTIGLYVCMCIYIHTYTYIYTYVYIYIPIVIAINDTTIYRYLADSYMVDMYTYIWYMDIYGYNLFCGIYTINELVHLRNQFHRLYCRISCIRHISTIDRHSLVPGLSYSVKCISIWE